MQGLTPSRSPRPSGFTLIEVLVVVAIIALLLSILLPSLNGAREQAKAVACSSNLKQITTGLAMYRNDNRGSLPPTVWSESAWSAEKADLWFYKLKKELPDGNVFHCPGDPFASKFDFEGVHRRERRGSVTITPRVNADVPSCGYGMNYLFRHFAANDAAFRVGYYEPKRPANTLMLAEVGPDDQLENIPIFAAGAATLGGQPWRDGGRIVWDDGARPWYTGPSWLTARHRGAINMASLDGAVHRVRTKEVIERANAVGIESFYEDCARGGCYFCNYHRLISPGDAFHYNFSIAKLYWWTGDRPAYP